MYKKWSKFRQKKGSILYQKKVVNFYVKNVVKKGGVFGGSFWGGSDVCTPLYIIYTEWLFLRPLKCEIVNFCNTTFEELPNFTRFSTKRSGKSRCQKYGISAWKCFRHKNDTFSTFSTFSQKHHFFDDFDDILTPPFLTIFDDFFDIKFMHHWKHENHHFLRKTWTHKNIKNIKNWHLDDKNMHR